MMIHGQLGGKGLGAMRTDRNANPIAAAVRAGSTNAYTQALDQAGILWTWGDPFPGDPSMVTIKVLGDPVAGARAILAGSSAIQDWYINHTGKTILAQYGVSSGAQFAALPTAEQNAIIAGIYKSEGGSGELMTGGYSLSLVASGPVEVSAPADYSIAEIAAGTAVEDEGEQQEFSGVDGVGLSGTTIALLVAAAVVGVVAFT